MMFDDCGCKEKEKKNILFYSEKNLFKCFECKYENVIKKYVKSINVCTHKRTYVLCVLVINGRQWNIIESLFSLFIRFDH